MADAPAGLCAVDRLDPGLLARFRATLGCWLAPVPDGTAPLGAHWCLFPPLADTAALGPDGHPPRLHAVSELDYPRRMWVGGRIELLRPFPVGSAIERRSELRPLERKEGRSGGFILTGLDHRYCDADGPLMIERQEIAYRPAAGGEAARTLSGEAIPQADLRIEVETTPALLFRYSALTFNAHRIHFDTPYATGVERHEGLLVQGPLQATLLWNLAAGVAGRGPRLFRYRALQPLVAGRGLVATASRTADGIACAIHDGNGRRTFEAQAGDWGPIPVSRAIG